MKLPSGHNILNCSFADEALSLVQAKDWNKLDQLASQWLAPNGKLRSLLAQYAHFKSIEHILALRSAPDDDEGIWHDDGSRLLAFSLSLTLEHENVAGGEISIRIKGKDEGSTLPCQKYGTLVIFNTGHDGYEHRVSSVKSGQRLVLAGWCS